jgi:GR25 family glycosyltransferase involved in LPS biosynthesis
MNIHHYIVSGPDETREPYLREYFNKFGLDDKDITWLKGNNKNDLTDEFINTICDTHNNQLERKITKGEISCTYKHYLALQDIVQNEREYAVIMEDDVNFKDYIQSRLNSYLEELNTYYPNWNVLFDGDINTYYGKTGEYDEDMILEYKKVYNKTTKDRSAEKKLHGATRGANYYLINLKTAKMLLDNFLPFDRVIDHYYNKMFRDFNLKIYWAIPPFVHKLRRQSTAK